MTSYLSLFTGFRIAGCIATLPFASILSFPSLLLAALQVGPQRFGLTGAAFFFAAGRGFTFLFHKHFISLNGHTCS
ncbi:MAG: hypothetical protein ACPGRZ_11970 [Alphaproteobacteria bacterium]